VQTKSGSRLRQEALAEEFSVSRTPIRVALRQLEVKGAYQVRAELEGLAISLAVEWITDEHLDRMRHAQKRFAETVEKLMAVRKSKAKAQFKNVPNLVESNDESTASSSRPAETDGSSR
jgi:DNA-binding GntR family transcriptional regulator